MTISNRLSAHQEYPQLKRSAPIALQPACGRGPVVAACPRFGEVLAGSSPEACPIKAQDPVTCGQVGSSVKFAVMPVRRGDPARLLSAVNAQRAALGRPAWSGPVTAEALGAGSVGDVLDALDAGLSPEPGALRGAVVYLLGVLERRAPGRAVEVRIPPFAAIQCVAGPRHTRGTPPNVVETDAVTWMLLATGRISWAEATADRRLRASGPRADLSSYLPL